MEEQERKIKERRRRRRRKREERKRKKKNKRLEKCNEEKWILLVSDKRGSRTSWEGNRALFECERIRTERRHIYEKRKNRTEQNRIKLRKKSDLIGSLARTKFNGKALSDVMFDENQ